MCLFQQHLNISNLLGPSSLVCLPLETFYPKKAKTTKFSAPFHDCRAPHTPFFCSILDTPMASPATRGYNCRLLSYIPPVDQYIYRYKQASVGPTHVTQHTSKQKAAMLSPTMHQQQQATPRHRHRQLNTSMTHTKTNNQPSCYPNHDRTCILVYMHPKWVHRANSCHP
jgi:hypothetical protein